jgi:hypothetical protein
MFRRRNLLLLLAGVLVFGSSVVCGYGASAPAPAATAVLGEPSAAAQQPTQAAAAPEEPIVPVLLPTAVPTLPSTGGGPEPTQPPIVAPAIPEARRVTLEYPPRIRMGDSDVVRLTLEVDTLGNITPTAQFAGNTVAGQTVQVPNLYATHSVLAEARLDLAGVEIRPGDVISEPLLPGQSVTFYWSVRPGSQGTFRGTAWLFLHFIDKSTKEESRIPLSAQTVEIATAELFGLGGSLARTAGSVGSVVGAVLGFPFVSDVLKWLWKRARKSA